MTAHHVRAHAPTSRIAASMAKVAYHVALGKSAEDAAKASGATYCQLRDWQTRWPEVWKMLVDKAAMSLAESIRALAGTDAILSDPAAYWAQASRVDALATKHGVPLFAAADGVMTLSRFFEEWYLPNRLFEASPATVEVYRYTIKAWRLITGDPPVEKITPTLLALFRDVRLRMPGIREGQTTSPNTVRTNLRMLQTLLDKLGPAGKGNRDALGLLATVPWVRPPREELKIPKTVPPEFVAACMKAATKMRVPVLPDVSPSDWWRALLTVAWNTGIRRGTIFTMRWSEFDEPGKRLVLPAGRMKSRRPQIVPLNRHAMESLLSIKTDRPLIFPWPHGEIRRTFHHWFHELQARAGIPREKHFGLHTLRRTLATTLAEDHLTAAGSLLGHTATAVTLKHYIDPGPMVARALDSLPQPALAKTLSERGVA